MSHFQEKRTFKEDLHMELSQFLQKLNKICQFHKVQLEPDGAQLYNAIANCINPIAEQQPYNPVTLSNFLKQTLNNQTEKKLKSRYCNKDMTIVSGSTKLFGYFGSLFPSQSNMKESCMSHRSLLSSSTPMSSKVNTSYPHGLDLPKFKEEEQSYLQSNKSQEGENYRSRNSDENKKLYKLYPTSYKLQIIDYATKFGIREASEKYKLSTSKINIWAKSLNRVKQTRGRKPIDPDMQEKVCDWLRKQLEHGSVLTQKLIREKAKRISCSDEFKASKGWLQKFFKRRPELFQAYSLNRRSHGQGLGHQQDESNEAQIGQIKQQEELSIYEENLALIKTQELLFSQKNEEQDE